MSDNSGRGAVRAVIIRRSTHQIFADAKVPICSEDIMRRARLVGAEPSSHNPRDVQVRSEPSQGIHFVPALKVRALKGWCRKGVRRELSR